MVNKKNLSLILLFLAIGLLFVGCSSNDALKDTSSAENAVKVESDENKAPTENVVVANQSAVETTADKELIASDDVEIGELI